jgi:hypothetical protein
MAGEDHPHGADVERKEKNVQSDLDNNPEIVMGKIESPDVSIRLFRSR